MATPLRHVRMPISLLVGAAVVASACNGSSTAAEDPDELGFAGDESTTTVVETTTTEPSLSESDRVEAYCALAADLDLLEDEIDISDDFGPENSERLATAWIEFLAETNDVVPLEIADDFSQASVGIEAFVEALEETDYDYLAAFSQMDPDIINSDEIDDASDRLDQFEADVCGISDELEPAQEDPEDDDEREGSTSEALAADDVELITSLLETELGRQLFIEGMMEDSSLTTEQATCFVDSADLSTLLSFSQGTQAENAALVDLFSTLSECNIDISDFDG